MSIEAGYDRLRRRFSSPDTGAWRMSLDAAEWDDRLLRVLTPHQLWSWPWRWRYGLAVAMAAVATVLRWAILPWIGPAVPYNVALLAIVTTTILLGIGPGLLCMLLADVAVEVFVVGSFATGPDGATIARLVFSMAIGAFVVGMLHGTRVARLRSQKGESRLNALYASMTEGLASHEVVYAGGKAVDYVLTDVNPAFERITGIARERAVGARASALFGTGEPPYLDIYARVAASGQPEAFETHFAPMGKSFHVSIFSPGKGRFATVFEDITARMRAEEALRESEDKFRRIVETAHEGILLASPDGVITLANGRMSEMLGYTVEELIGRPGAELVADDAELARVQELSRKRAAGIKEHYEIRMRRKDGSEIWLLVSGTPVHDDSGRHVANLGMYVDITARKQNEEALRAAKDELERRVVERTAELVAAGEKIQAERQRLYDVLETLPAMICLLTPDHHVAFANRGFRDQFGEANGRRCHEYRFGLAEPCDFCESYDVLRTGQPHHWEVTTPDGKTVIEAHDYPFTDADGSPLILEMDLDITERKRAEAALLDRTEKLRAMASELTLAEQRERQKLARVLHDGLQQLLVAGNLRLARMGRSSDSSARQVAQEVSELLSTSIETSRRLTAELSPPVLEESGLVAALEWLARWVEEKHHLAMYLEAQGPEPTVGPDVAIMLFHATRELLFNAVKHAGVTAVRVKVDRGHDDIRITVTDEGAGFDPAKVRTEGGVTGKFGLFSIRERLGMLGGRLEIDSAPGRGSRFTLVAPLAAPSAAVAQAEGRDEGRGQVSVVLAHPGVKVAEDAIRVVLVDDHVVVRQGLAWLLRAEPDIAIVGEASDGPSAVTLVTQVRPDVVLMDISMPGMNGIEATRIIHAEMPEVRVIGLSMFDEADQGSAMRQAGAVGYVSKSGLADTLVDAIRRLARN